MGTLEKPQVSAWSCAVGPPHMQGICEDVCNTPACHTSAALSSPVMPIPCMAPEHTGRCFSDVLKYLQRQSTTPLLPVG